SGSKATSKRPPCPLSSTFGYPPTVCFVVPSFETIVIDPDFSVIKNLPSGRLIIPQGFPRPEEITSASYGTEPCTLCTLVCPSKAAGISVFLLSLSGFTRTVPTVSEDPFWLLVLFWQPARNSVAKARNLIALFIYSKF